jgi:hypothetical protein
MPGPWPGCRIVVLGQGAALAFAADELARYLAALAPGASIARDGDAPPDDPLPVLRLGTFAAFGEEGAPWPTTRDPALDDAIAIAVTGGAGRIAGSNPRGVLLAVYRFLTELGCRWVRPGADGEVLPATVDLAARAVAVAEVASYRHRGVCIEGAASYEHVRDLIDWLPKLGLNAYFTQFREAYTFFERWYAHRENPLLPPEAFSVGRARDFKARLTREIARRGLLLHDVGHGWTCDPLGIPGLGWEYAPPEVPPAAVPFLAEVGGRRALWHGVPIDTQLCYSQGEVRRLVTGDIADYAAAHPEVALLHIWLGDGANNHCECADCRALRPSDWYVRLLNEAAAALAARALPTRLVFLIYVDLLWPPEVERLHDAGRFVLMFAPITRTYSAAYVADEATPPALPPYERNRLRFPRDVAGNVAFLRAWQGQFQGDSFAFDYHLWRDLYKDPGGIANAAILHADIGGLGALGLDGLISCQVQRAFFPTGLGMATLGRALWDRTRPFRAIAEEYVRAAFGADGLACLAYCEELTALFDPPRQRGERPALDPIAAATYARVPATIAAFRPTIRRNLTLPEPCHARSWHLIDRHAELCLLLAEALRLRALGQDEAARAAWAATQGFVRAEEGDLHPALDGYMFQQVLGALFRAEGARGTRATILR